MSQLHLLAMGYLGSACQNIPRSADFFILNNPITSLLQAYSPFVVIKDLCTFRIVRNGDDYVFESPSRVLTVTKFPGRRLAPPFTLDAFGSSDEESEDEGENNADEDEAYWISMDFDIVDLINAVISAHQQNDIRMLAERLFLVGTGEHSCVSRPSSNAIPMIFEIAEEATYLKRVGIPNKLIASPYVCSSTAKCALTSRANWIHCGSGSFNTVQYIKAMETIDEILKPFTGEEQRLMKSLTPPATGKLPKRGPIEQGKFGIIWRKSRVRDWSNVLSTELFLTAYMGFKGVGPPLISGYLDGDEHELNIFMPAGQPLNSQENVLCCWDKVDAFLQKSANAGMIMLDLKLKNMLRFSIGEIGSIPPTERDELRDVSRFMNSFMMLNSICAQHENGKFVGSCQQRVVDELYAYLIHNVEGITSKIDEYHLLTKLQTQVVEGRILNFWDVMYTMITNYNSNMAVELNNLIPPPNMDVLDDNLFRNMIRIAKKSIKYTRLSADIPCDADWKYVPIDFDPRFTTISLTWFYDMPSPIQQELERPISPARSASSVLEKECLVSPRGV